MTFKNILFCIIAILTISSCIKRTSTTPTPDQFSTEVTAIKDTLANNTKDSTYLSKNNIGFAVHSFGENTPPHGGQEVNFTYQGRLLTNHSLVDTGSFVGPLNSFNIIGLQMALGSLPTGTKSLIYLPSKYAYGSNDQGKIPANSTIVYEVNLISTKKTASEQTFFDKDTAAIRKYLADSNNTTAIKHSSGIWYDIITEGTGPKPNIFHKITGTYSGFLMSNGYKFDSGDLNNLALLDLIDGFKVGVPLLKQGTIAKLYIPSGLAYAAKGASGIPANAPLIFEISLTSISR